MATNYAKWFKRKATPQNKPIPGSKQRKNSAGGYAWEIDDWQRLGVEGHFEAKTPWYSYHELLTPPMAEIVGAKESEVVCMNSLTTNIHLLFVSFYRPAETRYKIISEAKMFPSDRYLLETQAQFHGFDPDDALLQAKYPKIAPLPRGA